MRLIGRKRDREGGFDQRADVRAVAFGHGDARRARACRLSPPGSAATLGGLFADLTGHAHVRGRRSLRISLHGPCTVAGRPCCCYDFCHIAALPVLMPGLPLPAAVPELVRLMEPMAKALKLPPEWVQRMAEATRLCRFEAGQLFQVEGDPVDALYVVLRGRVKVFCASPQGREQVLHVAGPGDHINIVPIVDGGPGPASLQALTRVDLLSCSSAAFGALLEREPRLGLVMMRELARKQRQLVRLVDVLALHSVQGRVARLLLDRAEAVEQGQPAPPLTQTEMASQIGTVREMVARALKTLEGLGIIDVAAGHITVVDRAALEALQEN